MSTAIESARRTAVPVDGLLLLDKPAGITSNRALQKVKRLLKAKKAGHTGSLDPAATGMLPLCFGEATKVCAYLLEADKTYRVTAKLGEATNTGDADGEVTSTATVPDLDRGAWEQILEQFLGETEQVPPMYSALKKDGKRLYELARKGQVVHRDPRRIRIDEISLLEVSASRLWPILPACIVNLWVLSGPRTCLICPVRSASPPRARTHCGPGCYRPTSRWRPGRNANCRWRARNVSVAARWWRQNRSTWPGSCGYTGRTNNLSA